MTVKDLTVSGRKKRKEGSNRIFRNTTKKGRFVRE